MNNCMQKIKHKVLLMSVIGGMTLGAMTGCSMDAYGAYKEAAEKTDQAQSGVYALDFKVENTFDTQNATEEQLRDINYLKSIAVQATTTIDESKNSLISDVFASAGGIGFDFTFYNQNGALYVKYPIMKKYIDLIAMQSQYADRNASPMNVSLSEETQTQLKALWGNLATPETVKRVGKTVLPQKGGDVKVTQYTIQIEGEHLKKNMMESIKVIAADPKLKEQFLNSIQSNDPSRSSQKIEDQFNSLLKGFETLVIDTANMQVFIDADGYVVEKTIDVAYHNSNVQVQPRQTQFALKMTNKQLDQPVKIEMPVWTAENVYTKEELNKDMPALFKDFAN